MSRLPPPQFPFKAAAHIRQLCQCVVKVATTSYYRPGKWTKLSSSTWSFESILNGWLLRHGPQRFPFPHPAERQLVVQQTEQPLIAW